MSETINFSDFLKVDIRVGEVIEVEAPECLTFTSVEDMVTCLGADMVLNKTKAAKRPW